MASLTWTSCQGAQQCFAWGLTLPITTVVIVPLIAVLLGGLIKWAVAQASPILDYFMLGIELTISAVATSFTFMFDWGRKSLLGPVEPLPPLLISFAVAIVSFVMLIVVMALMGTFINKSAPVGKSSINAWQLMAINIAGALPFGLSALLLIG
jgi:hypothetical protein